MKTVHYNPSQIETEMANALVELKSELEKFLSNNSIQEIENRIQQDNPMILFHLVDSDGDPHELVIKLIQRPDKF